MLSGCFQVYQKGKWSNVHYLSFYKLHSALFRRVVVTLCYISLLWLFFFFCLIWQLRVSWVSFAQNCCSMKWSVVSVTVSYSHKMFSVSLRKWYRCLNGFVFFCKCIIEPKKRDFFISAMWLSAYPPKITLNCNNDTFIYLQMICIYGNLHSRCIMIF